MLLKDDSQIGLMQKVIVTKPGLHDHFLFLCGRGGGLNRYAGNISSSVRLFMNTSSVTYQWTCWIILCQSHQGTSWLVRMTLARVLGSVKGKGYNWLDDETKWPRKIFCCVYEGHCLKCLHSWGRCMKSGKNSCLTLKEDAKCQAWDLLRFRQPGPPQTVAVGLTDPERYRRQIPSVCRIGATGNSPFSVICRVSGVRPSRLWSY